MMPAKSPDEIATISTIAFIQPERAVLASKGHL
jgi:hypothetical protein